MATDEASMAGKLEHSITWKEWKERWEVATDVPTCLGLLHCVFSGVHGDNWGLGHKEEAERICLLFTVADRKYRDGKYEKISQAAYKQLANNFFKRFWTDERYLRENDKLNNEVIKASLRFFRSEFIHDGGARIPNLNRWSSSDKGMEYVNSVAGDFLTRFCRAIWELKYFQVPGHQEQMLEIMYARQQLLTLLPPRCYSYDRAPNQKGSDGWRRFNRNVMVKLEELVCRDGNTIHQGALNGSQAAVVLLAARGALAELKRVEKELEKKAEEQAAAKRAQEREQLSATIDDATERLKTL